MQPATPQRCTLVNVSTGERMACQFNPVRLQERIGAVQYAHLEPLGVPYQILHYRNTENRKLSVDFHTDAVGTGFDIAAFHRFLFAFTRPVLGHAPNGPPAMLLIWPNILTVTARVVELSFTYDQLATDGRPLICTAQCVLEVDEQASGGGSDHGHF